MKKKYLLLVVIVVMSCKPEHIEPVNPVAPPPPVLPKPSMTVSVEPSMVGYGDSTKVSFISDGISVSWPGRASEDIGKVSGSFMLRALKRDTSIVFSATGPGGTTTSTVKVSVALPDQNMLLLLRNKDAASWKTTAEYYWKVETAGGSEQKIAITASTSCEWGMVRTFYLDKRYHRSRSPNPACSEIPIGTTPWKFRNHEGKFLLWIEGVEYSASFSNETLLLERPAQGTPGVGIWTYRDQRVLIPVP
ncbi:MAG: hypothetical protein ACOYMZ_01045 [Minisyncoccia bacterium]